LRQLISQKLKTMALLYDGNRSAKINKFNNRTPQIPHRFKVRPVDNRNIMKMVFADTNLLQTTMHLLQRVHLSKKCKYPGYKIHRYTGSDPNKFKPSFTSLPMFACWVSATS